MEITCSNSNRKQKGFWESIIDNWQRYKQFKGESRVFATLWTKAFEREQRIISELDIFLLVEELKWADIENSERHCESFDWIY
jgi:hypothetical protein